MTVECHTTFTDPGATANDTCAASFAATPSGSVNANVPGTYMITYNASDPSGNAATAVTRTVYVRDTLGPIITLNGSNSMTVYCHTSFTDPGASATDACAGAVAVTPSGTVDTNTVGTYTITYNAIDPSGNAALSVMRLVNVINTVPVVDSVTGPAGPMAVGGTATVTANFTDPDPGQAHMCTITWDDPSNPTSIVTVSAGATSCTASHTYASAGVSTVSVDVSDYCDHATGVFQFVVIYDPNAGFVTGGGWINPPLRWLPAPCRARRTSASSRSTRRAPTFRKVRPNSSSRRETSTSTAPRTTPGAWSSPAAGRRRTGAPAPSTGVPGYRFLLIAYDGNQPGGDGIDRFRIKITQERLGHLRQQDGHVRGPRPRRPDRSRRGKHRHPQVIVIPN